MTDLVKIHQLELDCIVGLRPHERTRTQRVRLDLALELDTREAARGGRIEATADYDRVAHEVCALLRFRRYRLVEMAAEEICAMLLGTYGMISGVRLQLEKPGALEGRARAAAIEVYRSRADFDLHAPKTPPYPRRILQTRDAQLAVHSISPGHTVPEPAGGEQRAVSWVVSGQLIDQQGNLRGPGLAEDCEPAGSGAFRNSGGESVLLFRCVVMAQ